MDFSLFVQPETIPALAWLGKKDWLEFGYSPSFETRTVWSRLRHLELSAEEKQSPELLTKVQHVMENAGKDVVNSFLLLALSRSVANGPKVFQPTNEDCEALENTACTMTFDDYKQPYPVVIIEFPKEYKQKLANMWHVPKGPSHVIVHQEDYFVNVYAFFDKNNILSHITPGRPEYKSIEDAIVSNARMPTNDSKVAELSQRLAVNFCMVMVLLGVRQTGPLDPVNYAKAKKMASRKDIYHRNLGKTILDSTMFKVEFINQKIKLFEEEFIQPRQPEQASTLHHASPKVHWRRGHYRQQACGIKLSERKLMFIKPVLVMASTFGGDVKNTQVIYKLTHREMS